MVVGIVFAIIIFLPFKPSIPLFAVSIGLSFVASGVVVGYLIVALLKVVWEAE